MITHLKNIHENGARKALFVERFPIFHFIDIIFDNNIAGIYMKNHVQRKTLLQKVGLLQLSEHIQKQLENFIIKFDIRKRKSLCFQKQN
jgi:hypothetical protein